MSSSFKHNFVLCPFHISVSKNIRTQHFKCLFLHDIILVIFTFGMSVHICKLANKYKHINLTLGSSIFLAKEIRILNLRKQKKNCFYVEVESSAFNLNST